MDKRDPRSTMGLSNHQKNINQRTPFSLAYGSEVIILMHITVPSMSFKVGNIGQNLKQMKLNLDLTEGECKRAIVRVASYVQQLKSYYNKRAKVS